jgi:hypothetical protein
VHIGLADLGTHGIPAVISARLARDEQLTSV